jgi:hypothetical protein
MIFDRVLEKRKRGILMSKKVKKFFERNFDEKIQLRKIIDSPLYLVYILQITKSV